MEPKVLAKLVLKIWEIREKSYVSSAKDIVGSYSLTLEEAIHQGCVEFKVDAIWELPLDLLLHWSNDITDWAEEVLKT